MNTESNAVQTDDDEPVVATFGEYNPNWTESQYPLGTMVECSHCGASNDVHVAHMWHDTCSHCGYQLPEPEPCDICELSADVSNCVNCSHMPMHDEQEPIPDGNVDELERYLIDVLGWKLKSESKQLNPFPAKPTTPPPAHYFARDNKGDVFADGRSEFTKS